MLSATEVFDSIQGEGNKTGLICTFVRLHGCNLRCSWCDTKGTWGPLDTTKGHKMIDPIDLAYDLNHRSPLHVCWTGGEPLLQAMGIMEVVRHTPMKRHWLETNGTLAIPAIPFDWIVVSPKPPEFALHRGLGRFHELKFVIDELSMFDVVDTLAGNYPNVWVSLQPVNNDVEIARACIKYMTEKSSIDFPDRYRLSMQVHKFLGIR